MITPNRPSSRIPRIVLVIAIVCLLASFAGAIFVAAHRSDNSLHPTPDSAATPPNMPNKGRIAEHFGKLPLSLEINRGQTDQSVKFLSHGPGYDLFLTATEAVLRVQKPRTLRVDKSKKDLTQANDGPHASVREGTVLRLKMLGG